MEEDRSGGGIEWLGIGLRTPIRTKSKDTVLHDLVA